MNRRQNVATYVIGGLLAAVSWYNGNYHGEWLFESFIPILILGLLLVHRLRTKKPEDVESVPSVKKGAIAIAVVALLAQLHGQVRQVDDRVDSIESDVQSAVHAGEEAKSEAEEAKSEAEDVKLQAEGIKSQVDDLESKVSMLEIDVLYRR